MIVMDQDTCMVDVARFFLDFLKEESCGKCVPCREGIRQMLLVLEGVCRGEGKEGDVELLEELSKVIMDTSLCALGGSAPNPVLSTIRYFRDEYITHIRDKRCPAGVCKALVHYSIDSKACNGCHACFAVCPTGAITGTVKQPHLLDEAKCIKCKACYEACKFDAVLRR
jgi:ferredoxin